MNIFITYLFKNPEYFFGTALIVIFSICCHEFCHAWVAMKQGDPTAADHGHLTLNPLKQMGLTSLFMFLFVGLAWGSVPVDHSRLRHRFSGALVSFAGPCANLILFVIFSAALAGASLAGLHETVAIRWILQAAVTNAVLFLLNMIPIPGFDGWNIITGFFPRLGRTSSELIRGMLFVAVMLVFVSIKYLYLIAYLAVALLGQGFANLGKLAGL